MRKWLGAVIAMAMIGCAARPQPEPTLALPSAERPDPLGEVIANIEVTEAVRERALRRGLDDAIAEVQIAAMVTYARAHARGELPKGTPDAEEGLSRLAATATRLVPYLDLDTGPRELSRVAFEALAAKLGADAEYAVDQLEEEQRAPLGRELADGIAVLAPEYLDDDVGDRMQSALAQWADGNPKPRALVLDFSRCTTGSPDAATELFNELAPGKIAFQIATRDSKEQGLLRRKLEGKSSWGADLYARVPVFVVTSDRTRGVCEALAVGLRAERNAEIIGAATPGDGRLMARFALPHRGMFAFAVAELFTASGTPLRGSPLLPDLCVGADHALVRLTPRDAAAYQQHCKALQELHPASILNHVRASLPAPSTDLEPIPPLQHGQPKT